MGVLGFAVLEVLGFIPDDAEERNPLEEVEVPHEYVRRYSAASFPANTGHRALKLETTCLQHS